MGPASRTRSRGICDVNFSRIATVASAEWSFTTRISPISGCRASDSTQAAMTPSSLRAGTMALMRGLSCISAWTIGLLSDQVSATRRKLYYSGYGIFAETARLGNLGNRSGRSGLFRSADLSPGRSVHRRKNRPGFCLDAQWQAGTPLRPAREGRCPEFLGELVPAVRRRNARAQSAPATHLFTRRYGARSERRRRS